ncbi:MAG: sulfotransferase [Anaerolineales bacterium]|nr:sulfotransferase [Anaerolineales bacterium]
MTYNLRLFLRLAFRSWFKPGKNGGRWSSRRLFFITLFYLVWPAAALIHWACLLLDGLIFPGYKKQKIERPLFIIGNFRNGSTMLQRLLARDEENFACMKLWEIFLAPSILERKFFNLISRIDSFFGSPLKKLALNMDSRSMGQVDIHKISFFSPEEDENILLHIWASYYIVFLFPFPEELPDYVHFDENVDEKEKKEVMRYYRKAVQRHLYAHPESKHYLSKSPSFSPKVRELVKRFADANFIYLTRTPLETIPSTISWLGYAWNVFSDPGERYPNKDKVVDLVDYWYHYPREQLKKLPNNQQATIRYEELVDDPQRVVTEIYNHFGYSLSPKFEKILQDFSKENQSYTSTHHYDLEEMGLDIQVLLERFRDVFEEFGYPEQ